MSFSGLKKMFLALTLVFATTVASTQKSHAIVGLASWNPPLMGAGLLAATVGYAGTMIAGAGTEYAWETGNPIFRAGAIVAGGVTAVFIVVAWIGQIALKDGHLVGVEFAEITPQMRQDLGITAAEARAFNQERDQVTIVAQQVAEDLARIPRATVADSERVWERYTGLLSAPALSATSKIFVRFAQH